MRLASFVLALSTATAAPALAVPNLVQNGNFQIASFSTPSGTGNPGSALGGMPGYNVVLNGWTNANYSTSYVGYNFVFATQGTPSATNSGLSADQGPVNGYDGAVQLWGPGTGVSNGLTQPPTNRFYPTASSNNVIGMDGAYQSAPLYQYITGLTKGVEYTVSFYWAAAQQSGHTGPTSDYMTVCLNSSNSCSLGTPGTWTSSTSTTPQVNIASEAFSGWQAESYNFTADSSSDYLNFFAFGSPAGVPPFALLADVAMTVTPEPANLTLFGLGVAGLVLLRLRRMARDRAVAA